MAPPLLPPQKKKGKEAGPGAALPPPRTPVLPPEGRATHAGSPAASAKRSKAKAKGKEVKKEVRLAHSHVGPRGPPGVAASPSPRQTGGAGCACPGQAVSPHIPGTWYRGCLGFPKEGTEAPALMTSVRTELVQAPPGGRRPLCAPPASWVSPAGTHVAHGRRRCWRTDPELPGRAALSPCPAVLRPQTRGKGGAVSKLMESMAAEEDFEPNQDSSFSEDEHLPRGGAVERPLTPGESPRAAWAQARRTGRRRFPGAVTWHVRAKALSSGHSWPDGPG